VADYTGTFNGSFTGSFTGDLVGVDYYDLENSPPTITPHQANQITANSNFRENFKANLNSQGLISSSAQVDYGSVSNIPSGIVSSSQQTKDYLPSGVVSSSQQTIQNLPNGTISGSVQVDYGSISNIPNGIVSSSQQTKDYLPSGTISSSQQITITESQISDLVHYTDTDVKNKLNVEGVISSSQQIVADLPSGTISSSAQVDYGSVSNTPSGIVSSSAQIVSNLVGQYVVVQSMSGSFSGSFEGDGSGLTNVPASGVVGLNLTRISTTNVTASVSEGTDTFKITSGSETPFSISNQGIISGTGSGLLDLDATETNIQTTILSNQNVGGVSSGESFVAGTDVEDILRQILIQFIPSDINSLLLRNDSSNVSTGVREVNSAITTDEFRITVSQNDPNLLTPINLSLTGSGATSGNFENYYGTSLSDGTNDITISPDKVLNINTIPSANSANITITARAEDPTDGSILSTSRNYSYVYPFYYGATSTDLSSATGTTLETYLTKLTQTKGTKSVTLVATSEYLYFGYPSRYGDLSTIKDGNNFDVTSNFTKYTITIDGGNGWNSVSYYLYRSTTTTTITSQTYTFTF